MTHRPIAKPIPTLYLTKILVFFSSYLIFLTPQRALAIPSPELVIGSVSSLSQFLALGLSAVTGICALLARRFGYKPKNGIKSTKPRTRTIVALMLIAIALATLNIWQYRSQNAEEMAGLQATLVRPAQFKGTEIQDSNLKETSFDKQTRSSLALTTEQAQRLLQDPSGEGKTVFFDVRETGEYRMGTLPGAQHVRFPDFLSSSIPLEGKQVVLFCHNGNRSSETCAALAARGIDCRFIAGGIEKWIVEGRSYSDSAVTSLSDLRAIPDYPNKNTLMNTRSFTKLLATNNIQIVDTRYPGDFATGHLPGAINIPIRALPTEALKHSIAQLENKPTIAACYDRRSCFMSQVLGLELSEAGIDFRGRYTAPWEYFVAPKPKPHVQQWLAEQQITFWEIGVNKLADLLVWFDQRWHFVGGLFALSLLSRLLILPIALKSERDQLVMADQADALKALKNNLKGDPTRKARAIKQFNTENGLTPMRNLIALLFLPVMMLGLSATEMAGASVNSSFLWIQDLGKPDTTFLLPISFALLAGTYLHWAVAKKGRRVLWWMLGVPLMFGLVYRLSTAGNIYLCIGLSLLLVQRAYVTGLIGKLGLRLRGVWRRWKVRNLFPGVCPLNYTEALHDSGNKSYRLSVLKNAGIPVPDGLVIRFPAVTVYSEMSSEKKDRFAGMVWRLVDQKQCAVRSSANGEDGTDQSFAGVFESVLNVDKGNMRQALDKVVNSFFSERAKIYDSEGASRLDGNILIQQMVRSQYAGVLFTQDPVAPGLAMVELVKGCGDDLVSGRVTPVSLRFGRYTHAEIGDRAAPIDLKPLLTLGKKVEGIFGTPQDIEWAFCDGVFYIVQSRDITTLTGKNPAEQARTDEWQRIFQRFSDADPNTVILEQDEMSEVLPRPTPLSLALMTRLWAPGGSVDLACRELGVAYNIPEGRPGHLISFFGLTYVDCRMKQRMALHVSPSTARQLRKLAVSTLGGFRKEKIDTLEKEMALWNAVDFHALPRTNLISCIEQLQDKLVNDIYIEAEKINILAEFTLSVAETVAKNDVSAQNRLMNPALRHSPVSLIAACARLKGEVQKSALMASMGHRSVFDYELSTPRYREAPDLLIPLLNISQPLSANDTGTPHSEPIDPIDLAIEFQDLKELAKHEALKIVAEIRRAVLALADKTGFGDLIFHLEMEELLSLTDEDPAKLRVRAQMRKKHREQLLKDAPKNVSFTLRECEVLSASGPIEHQSDRSALGGTCVSGTHDITGRVFVVQDETAMDESAFAGFEDGDIIVCRMVSPAWLPFVQRSGGVLSEVGGWLSHMAIVAREKGILMLVRCTGLDGLQDRMTISAGIDGTISIVDRELFANRKSA